MTIGSTTVKNSLEMCTTIISISHLHLLGLHSLSLNESIVFILKIVYDFIT